MSNKNAIKEIETTYREISNQYGDSLYDKTDPYFLTYQRIHNAVTILFNYAIKSQNDTSTLNKIRNIMVDIKEIRNLLASYNYNPEKFLILNPIYPPVRNY